MGKPGLRGNTTIVLIGLAILLLAACGGKSDPANNAAATEEMTIDWPDYVASAPPRVRSAYEFAVSHPEVLMYQPCYCGCGGMGHTSNLSCFVSELGADGSVAFDNHAAGCGLCVDIAQDAQRLYAEGWTRREIRAYIDAQYSAFGPGTDTAYPPED